MNGATAGFFVCFSLYLFITFIFLIELLESVSTAVSTYCSSEASTHVKTLVDSGVC